MSWARILAPLSGHEGDRAALAAGAALARPFGAELRGAFVPADMSNFLPWMGDGFTGGVQTAAFETIKQATEEGESAARASTGACGYEKAAFVALPSPVAPALAMQSRLADVVVFGSEPAAGRGPLAEAFQQLLADEQRPLLIARDNLDITGVIAVAWDGGKEASRAARLALPLLEKARSVVIFTAPKAISRKYDPEGLQGYYAARGLRAEVELLSDTSDPSKALLEAARAAGAGLMVAGAFGHTRLKEFIFGGATRTFLNSERPSLFLSH